jgi:large subunit ribosomal protein L17
MTMQRKLGRATDQRMAILRNLVSALLVHGKIETTEARAKEVKRIAEKLIASAIREVDNITPGKSVRITKAKIDSKGQKMLKDAVSKNGRKYKVVDREETTEMKASDKPSRLAARRNALTWLNDIKDENGNSMNVVNELFDKLATKYKETHGGYTRIYKMGPRRGDSAEMVIIELV